jgi:hypothetical protein
MSNDPKKPLTCENSVELRGFEPLTPSMRTRLLASADVSSCVWIPGKAKESNALIGSMWPEAGRRWLPTWLPRVDGHRGRPPR